MKYRIITDDRGTFVVQYKVLHLFWIHIREDQKAPDGDFPIVRFSTIERAEQFIERDASETFRAIRERTARKKAAKKVIKVFKFDSQDELSMRLRGK
jgi:hypothetical protein